MAEGVEHMSTVLKVGFLNEKVCTLLTHNYKPNVKGS